MAGSKEQTVIAFDLYGTILSTASVAKELSKLLDLKEEKANEVASLWRRYQLEYSWRLTAMQKYIPFSTITLNSLHQALLELSIPLPSTKDSLSKFNTSILKAYDSLTIFPDSKLGLESLSTNSSLTPFIFSNGTSSMLSNSVHESDDLKSFAKIFEKIVSVESTNVFKPAPDVYRHLVKEVGKKWEERGKVWLVSGNPFDVVGAKHVGLRAAWVDREGKGWQDRLFGEEEGMKPDLIVKGVDDAVKGVAGWSGDQ